MSLFDKTLAVCQSTQTPEQCVVAARYLKLAKPDLEDYLYQSIRAKLTVRLNHIVMHEMMNDLAAQGYDIRPRKMVAPSYSSFFIHDEDNVYVARITFDNGAYHSHKVFSSRVILNQWLKRWSKQLS